MDNTGIEVKSALWQKVFASLVFLPFLGIGVVCWLSSWVPILVGQPPHWSIAFVLGAVIFVIGFGFWWTVMRYSVRADSEGIRQSNGFFHQAVRWEEVTHYYMETGQSCRDVNGNLAKPIMLNAQARSFFVFSPRFSIPRRKLGNNSVHSINSSTRDWKVKKSMRHSLISIPKFWLAAA